jgi:hypothetical protein
MTDEWEQRADNGALQRETPPLNERQPRPAGSADYCTINSSGESGLNT